MTGWHKDAVGLAHAHGWHNRGVAKEFDAGAEHLDMARLQPNNNNKYNNINMI